MQIIAINPSRHSQQIWLKFNDDSLLPLHIDDLYRLKLSKFTDLANSVVDLIRESSAKFLLTEYCLRQVAISPKVESILRQKLKIFCQRLIFKYNFPSVLLSSLIGPIIDKLSSQGLLDPTDYANYLLRKFPKKSRLELNYRLSRLGIDLTLPVDRSLELEKVKKQILKKLKSLDLTEYNSRSRLIANLSHKGFPIELIKTAIDEIIKVR